ncbi:MAG: sigma-54-dependent Fis family transcriptional regulator [Candidatus Cloacimonetes bacterium]|nr:sigma-54-dependent Fis family transcriptional regulator [Candidatus Cloacimonadota bacterium]
MSEKIEKDETKKMAKILIVDDEQDTRDIFRRQLEDEYLVDTAESAFIAIEKIKSNTYHIAMIDLVMPGEDGLELLKNIKNEWPQIAVMVISGKASIEMAVQAMKLGADEFIEKPVEDLDLLKLMIKKILKIKWQTEEIKRLRSILKKEFDRTHIVGNSLAIQEIMEKVKRIAPLDTTVLISGETGVGKELFAELIYKNSNRKNKKFVTVNCGSLPENLLESTLFGHKKGSFTSAIHDKIGYFQEADSGTLFLDEITETSPEFQVKLLRALEKGVIRQVGGENDISVDVRIITATNKDLEEEIINGNLREDLYYRINVINLHIPPLRERMEDIKLLTKSFVTEFCKKYNKPDLKISDAVFSILSSNEWKGNIRELRNAIEHAVALTDHDTILSEDLPASINITCKQNDRRFSRNYDNLTFSNAKDIFEKTYIENLMSKCNGEVTKASKISNIKRQNLYEKFKKYDIDPNSYRINK